MSELSGIELRRAVAEALGWTQVRDYGPHLTGWRHGDSYYPGSWVIPSYESDLKALSRDMVSAKGVSDVCLAEAICRAVLAVVKRQGERR